jgi:hypothetical protein
MMMPSAIENLRELRAHGYPGHPALNWLYEGNVVQIAGAAPGEAALIAPEYALVLEADRVAGWMFNVHDLCVHSHRMEDGRYYAEFGPRHVGQTYVQSGTKAPTRHEAVFAAALAALKGK